MRRLRLNPAVQDHPSLFTALYIMGCQICRVSGGGVGTLTGCWSCVRSSSRLNSIRGIKSSLRRRQMSEILAAGRSFSRIAVGTWGGFEGLEPVVMAGQDGAANGDQSLISGAPTVAANVS